MLKLSFSCVWVGSLYWLDVSYFDRTKWFAWFVKIMMFQMSSSQQGLTESQSLGTLQFSTSVEGRLLIFSRSVREQDFSKTALRIFLIFCMNLLYHKGKKRTRPFVRENSGSFNNHENVPKTALFWLWWEFDGKPRTGLFGKIFFMKLQVFRSITAKTACPGRIWFFF